MKRLLPLLIIVLSVCLLFSGCSLIKSVLDRWNNNVTEDVPHTHSYTAVVTEPTETDGGYTTYTCDCGDSYVSDYTQMLGYYSKGFEFELTEDGSGYILTDIGDCEDADIVIPAVHNGLPVVALGEYALCKYDFITSISIPNTITSIGEAAIAANINLIEIKISPNNACYKVVDGTLYTKDGKVLVQYAIGKRDTTFNIPSGVTEIASSAFAFAGNLENVIIPDTVTVIGEIAFAICESLTEIIIPDSVTQIDESAFEGCVNLVNVVMSSNISRIEDFAFADCVSLRSINLPESLMYLGYRVFMECDNLVQVENGISYVDNWIVDANLSGSQAILRKDTIGICDGAFSRCYSLTSIYIDSNNAYYQSIDGNLYTKDGKTLIQYAAGKTDTSFVIPDGVTSIGYYAFYHCTSLTSITISSSVTTIGDYAFY